MDEEPCPVCGSLGAVPIVYGYPEKEAFKAEERGEISLGGCVVHADDPVWRCRTCGWKWGRLGA
jgi:hypothetical protein